LVIIVGVDDDPAMGEDRVRAAMVVMVGSGEGPQKAQRGCGGVSAEGRWCVEGSAL
jgi:hypothetical protein